MKTRFYSKAAKVHFYACFILLAVIVGMHLANWISNDNSLPSGPDKVKLEKAATLRGRVNNENFEVKVKKGHEITILGARKGTMTEPERLWVELEDGSRGYIYCTDFNLEYKAQLKGKKRLVPVKMTEYDGSKMVCELEDGSKKKLSCDDIYPQWPDSWNFKYLSTNTYSSYISKSKFERKYIGSTLEKNDSRLVPARYILKKGKQTYAFYPMYVLDTSDGMRYAPTVVYDESGEAKSYVNEDSRKRAKFFLKIMPLVGATVDNPLLHSLIRGTTYEMWPQAKGDPSLLKKILGLLVFVIYLLFVAIWLYATPMVPVLVLALLMHFPKVLYPLGNRTLYVTMLVLTIVCAYLWGALLVGWGIMWLFLLPLPFVALFIFGFASSPVASSAPSGRCIKCRNIETMEFVDTVYDHEYKEWNKEKKFDRVLDKQTIRWQTWTQKTKTYSDGRKETWKENIQDHQQTTTTSLYNDYNVHYNVTVYKNNYTCCVCGQHEHNISKDYEVLEKKHLGSHSETHVS